MTNLSQGQASYSSESEVEDRTGELLQLSDNLKDGLDQKIQSIKNLPEYQRNTNTEFDKLRKRLKYLTSQSKSNKLNQQNQAIATGKDSIDSGQQRLNSVHAQRSSANSIEIDPRFLREDKKKSVDRKKSQLKNISAAEDDDLIV